VDQLVRQDGENLVRLGDDRGEEDRGHLVGRDVALPALTDGLGLRASSTRPTDRDTNLRDGDGDRLGLTLLLVGEALEDLGFEQLDGGLQPLFTSLVLRLVGDGFGLQLDDLQAGRLSDHLPPLDEAVELVLGLGAVVELDEHPVAGIGGDDVLDDALLGATLVLVAPELTDLYSVHVVLLRVGRRSRRATMMAMMLTMTASVPMVMTATRNQSIRIPRPSAARTLQTRAGGSPQS